MGRPCVSVVIPVFNSAALLPRALRSIKMQEFGDWEAVVVDDGSTDEVADVLSDWRQRMGDRLVIVSQPNRGPSAARNAGIQRSRGEYVAFLDADDEFLPKKLQRHLELFEAVPKLGLTYSDYRSVSKDAVVVESVLRNGDGLGLEPPREPVGLRLSVCKGSLFDTLIGGYFVATLAGVVRKCVLDRRIRFQGRNVYSEEWLFYLQVARACPAGFIDEPLAIHHAVDGSLARTSRSRNSIRFRTLLHSILAWFPDLSRSQRQGIAAKLHHTCLQIGFDHAREGGGLGCLPYLLEAIYWKPRPSAIRSALGACLAAAWGATTKRFPEIGAKSRTQRQ